MNKRLKETLAKIEVCGKGILGIYNKTIYYKIAPTITTRVNASCSIYVVETEKENDKNRSS